MIKGVISKLETSKGIHWPETGRYSYVLEFYVNLSQLLISTHIYVRDEFCILVAASAEQRLYTNR